MKKIIIKTAEEIEKEGRKDPKMILVEDTGMYYLACEKCQVAFFKGDFVLKGSDNRHRCLLKKPLMSKFFRKKIVGVCNERIYGGDEKCFKKYYKLKEDCV